MHLLTLFPVLILPDGSFSPLFGVRAPAVYFFPPAVHTDFLCSPAFKAAYISPGADVFSAEVYPSPPDLCISAPVLISSRCFLLSNSFCSLSTSTWMCASLTLVTSAFCCFNIFVFVLQLFFPSGSLHLPSISLIKSEKVSTWMKFLLSFRNPLRWPHIIYDLSRWLLLHGWTHEGISPIPVQIAGKAKLS